MCRGAGRHLLRLPLQLGGGFAVGLGGDPHSRGGLFYELDRRGDLGEAVGRAFRDGLDPPDLRLTRGHGGRDVLHLLADRARGAGHFLRCPRRLVGELAHLLGDHREAAAVLTGPCRFDRRVQRQQVGLRRDALDELHEVVDRHAQLAELADLVRGGLHHLPHVEQHAPGGGDVAPVPVGYRADLLAELRRALRRVRHVAGGGAKRNESGAHGGEGGALLVRTARDLHHGRRDLARGRRELLAHRRQVPRRPGDPVRLADHVAHDLPEAVPHLLDGVRQHAELAGHLPGGDRSQIAGAEPLGGRHQAAQRPVYRLDRVARQEEARDHESDDEDPELALPIGCVRAQPLRDLRRLLRLPLGEITHQPRQLRRLGPHRRRSRGRFLIASQVPERVCDRVLSLDGRVELLHAVHGEAILDGEAAQPIQPALVLEGLLGGGLELSPRVVPG